LAEQSSDHTSGAELPVVLRKHVWKDVNAIPKEHKLSVIIKDTETRLILASGSIYNQFPQPLELLSQPKHFMLFVYLLYGQETSRHPLSHEKRNSSSSKHANKRSLNITSGSGSSGGGSGSGSRSGRAGARWRRRRRRVAVGNDIASKDTSWGHGRLSTRSLNVIDEVLVARRVDDAGHAAGAVVTLRAVKDHRVGIGYGDAEEVWLQAHIY
jgi:hypothetical protein